MTPRRPSAIPVAIVSRIAWSLIIEILIQKSGHLKKLTPGIYLNLWVVVQVKIVGRFLIIVITFYKISDYVQKILQAVTHNPSVALEINNFINVFL